MISTRWQRKKSRTWDLDEHNIEEILWNGWTVILIQAMKTYDRYQSPRRARSTALCAYFLATILRISNRAMSSAVAMAPPIYQTLFWEIWPENQYQHYMICPFAAVMSFWESLRKAGKHTEHAFAVWRSMMMQGQGSKRDCRRELRTGYEREVRALSPLVLVL